MLDRLKDVLNQYEELRLRLCQPEVLNDPTVYAATMKEYNHLEPLAVGYQAYEQARRQAEDARTMMEEENDPELKELAEQNVDAARGKLLDLLCNYQGVRKCQLIVVFDAYRVVGHKTEVFDYHNIHVVYTKEAETADAYIEKFAHENGRKYHVTVATSDGLEQIIIRGQGCFLLSAKELEADLKAAEQEALAVIDEKKERMHNYLLDAADEETLAALRKRDVTS